MKKTLFLAVAAVTALFSACSSDELATNGATDGNMVNVTFNADFDQTLVTRGVAGESDGTAATNLYVAVYNKDKQLIEAISHIGTTNSQAIETVSGKAATVNFQLVKGQTYSFVFWAQNPNATTGAVVFDPTTGKVNVDYSKIKANDETLDAFTAHVNDLTVTGALSQSVTLKRPWAQVNYGSAQADWDAAVAAGITVAKSKVTVNNVYRTLNALTGEVEGPAETADIALAANTIPASATSRTLTVSGTNYKYIGLNYLLVGNEGEQSLIKADLEIQKESGEVINTLTFSNVPVQRNYRTNIVGNLLTSQVQFNITIDNNYDDDNNVEYMDPVTIKFSEFKTALLANGGTYDGHNAVTVVLKDSERSIYNNKTNQFYLGAEDQENISVSNVTFSYEDDDLNNEQVTGEIQVMSKKCTFTGCTFQNNTSLDPWGYGSWYNTQPEEAVIENCTFKNLEGRYAIHQNRAKKLTVKNCTFENCQRGIHTNSTNPESIVIKNNVFTGLGADYAMLCIAEGGQFTSSTVIDITDNNAEGQTCLRQLNATITKAQVRSILDNSTNVYGTAYTDSSKDEDTLPTSN